MRKIFLILVEIVEWIEQHCADEHEDEDESGGMRIQYRWDRKNTASSIPYRPNAGSRTNSRTIDIKSIESYISAIIDLFHEQVRKGDNTQSNFPNTEALKRYKLTIKSAIGKFKNDSMEDRGIPNAGLKASEYKRLGEKRHSNTRRGLLFDEGVSQRQAISSKLIDKNFYLLFERFYVSWPTTSQFEVFLDII